MCFGLCYLCSVMGVIQGGKPNSSIAASKQVSAIPKDVVHQLHQ